MPDSLTPADKSLREGLRGTDNAFGVLRLVLATLVLVDHAFPLGGFGEDPLWRHSLRQESFGGLAVVGFFAISGYLIARSAARADIVQFLWRRILRLFPGYWVMLVLTAVVVGPVLWSWAHEPGSYWTTGFPGPLTYFTHNWTLRIGQYGLHDLLTTTTPYGQSIHASALNGSIWTLIYEWHAYLLIAGLLLGNVFRRARWLVVVIAAAFVLLQIVQQADPAAPARVAPFLGDQYTISLTCAFMVAAALAVYGDRVPCDTRLGLASGAVMLLTLRYGGFLAVGVPFGAYFVLWLAAALPPVLRRVGRKNDYSYGIYIYGFLVQQVLAYKGAQRWGYLPYLLLSIALSFLCGFLSWHLIEKQALRLKSWGPGRGLGRITARITAWRPDRDTDSDTGGSHRSRRVVGANSIDKDERAVAAEHESAAATGIRS